MMPQTNQAPAALAPRQRKAHGRERSRGRTAAAPDPAALDPAAEARSGARGVGVLGVIPYLAVVVSVVAGVYISWHQGSPHGGVGGVIAGGAFFVAAIIRLTLPRGLAGPLASRSRAMDVLTLMAFGVCLLVLGILLPRLRAGYRRAEQPTAFWQTAV